MWKKEEETSAPQNSAEREPRAASPESGSTATIGPSITISGTVSGDEDLLIHGRLDGSIELAKQCVTVGSGGRVKADIKSRVVIVEGEVEGDLKADEQVVLRSAARVEGDITSPRVVLEDGANFKGLVDMSNSSSAGGANRGASSDRSGKGEESESPLGASGPNRSNVTSASSDAGGTSSKASPKSGAKGAAEK